MPFISVSAEMNKKSFTSIENKFITKYMPALDPMAVKVYLYALYLCQSGLKDYTLFDFAEALQLDEEKVKMYFEYLEEYELAAITSSSPFEVRILEAENVYGAPKKYKPEKYADFVRNVQDVISGRMISPHEFGEYFYLLEEYGFEQNALVMIIRYCVNLKGDNINCAYIKKVAKSFADEGNTTAIKVDEKLSSYTSSTPALIRLFTAIGIKRQPDIDDDKLYKKWTKELGFEEQAIITAAKLFKSKQPEGIDNALGELYKNKKFDVKEIEDYCKARSSMFTLAFDTAKNLGVYIQTAAPYVENYINVWLDYGYSAEAITLLSYSAFKDGKNSFEDLDNIIENLYKSGVVDDKSVKNYLTEKSADDKLIRRILDLCGLTRKIISWDRETLARWKSLGFGGDMLFEAAKLSAGKSNPLAYMNGVLSSWKSEGVTSPSCAPAANFAKTPKNIAAEIDRHYSELRQIAESRAEKALEKATADPEYAKLRKQLNDLKIKRAFAEIQGDPKTEELAASIGSAEKQAALRLKEIGIDSAAFTPRYKCKICNDTGYDKDGNPCKCLDEFLKTLK